MSIQKKVKILYSLGAISLAGVLAAPAQAGWFDDLMGAVTGKEDGNGGGGNAGSIVEQIQALSDGDISQAFKQALDLGSQQVVQQLSLKDGFNSDELIHIPLPSQFDTARDLLEKVNMTGTLDDLEVRLNRAAEAATPQAKALFADSIKQMSFEDVRGIYEGADNSATLYFQEKMTASLSEAMEPIVSQSLLEVGAISYYDKLISAYKTLPFVPDLKADLTEHVVNGSLNGVFYYLAEQEAAIRKDPIKQTTELLKKVFGEDK